MDIDSFGKLHPSKQQYDCNVENLKDLVKLTKGSPFTNWTDDYAKSVAVEDFTTWFPNDRRIFLRGEGDQQDLSYKQLRETMIQTCPSYNKATTVAVLLPLELRAETAVALVALLSQCMVTVAPLDFKMPTHKIKEAFDQLECKGIITTRELERQLKEEGVLDDMEDIRVVDEYHSDVAGIFRWKVLRQYSPSQGTSKVTQSLPKDHPRMLLRTSGTTANPKVVALPASQLIHAAIGLAHGLKLSAQDVCICAMPLFHIGGIAGALLCVLVSGSSVLMVRGIFDPFVFLELLDPARGDSTPTWYYAAPTMHKSLLMTAQTQGLATVPNRLRLVRSAAAHLPHQLALDLAKLYGRAGIYPTYGMSECMPIAIPHEGIVNNRAPKVIDTVGLPAACSISIVDDELGEPVPYGEIGEIAVRGPGAMDAYVGISKKVSHTPQGWLKTGDVGCLDEQGHLFIKGRSKEMIKRGGEQVWPTEIDLVVEKHVPGIAVALTFAVPNDLWGEEVAIAVVLQDDAKQHKVSVEKAIIDVCNAKLDHFAVPQQVLFVESKDELPKGATGKYLRRKIAKTFGVEPVDTGILRAFNNGSANGSRQHEVPTPSSALNGVRVVAAFFVTMNHVGCFETKAWIKLQSFTLSMPIFFFLLAFQLGCNSGANIQKRWGSFVGSKIGAMHGLYVIAQVLKIPTFLLFKPKKRFKLSVRLMSIARHLMVGISHLSVGSPWDKDGFANPLGQTWFSGAAYTFIIGFPFLNSYLHSKTLNQLLFVVVVSAAASVIWPYFLLEEEQEMHFTVYSWIPHLVASAAAGNLFRRVGPLKDQAKAGYLIGDVHIWGLMTDMISAGFLVLLVYTCWFSADCLWVSESSFEEMRPGNVDYEERDNYAESQMRVCNVTIDEFNKHIRGQQATWDNQGRWETDVHEFLFSYPIGSPLVLIWLYGLSFGRGLTAKLMKNQLLQSLAHLTYPIYLLHTTVADIYWLATRGFERQHWWRISDDYPHPVSWMEMCLVFALSGAAGYILDSFVAPHVIPYTVKYWVFLMQSVERFFNASLSNDGEGGESVFDNVKSIVCGISGVEISQATRLDSMGLESLGASAFLGLLRQRVPAAKDLTLSTLISQFETVEDLVTSLSRDQGPTQSRNLCSDSSSVGSGAKQGYTSVQSCDSTATTSIGPSISLNGVRCFAALFVVLMHIGHFDSKALTKIQSFTLNMPIFFFLLAFQMACTVQANILKRWGVFVGSKIGSLHAMFVIAQVFAAPGTLYWFSEPGESIFPRIASALATTLHAQLVGRKNPLPDSTWIAGNMFGLLWFQTVAYQFLIAFPFLNSWIQDQSTATLVYLLVFSTIASVLVPTLLFEELDMEVLHYRIWSWIPHLVASTVAGNIFKRYGPLQSVENHKTAPFLQNIYFWGKVTDMLSIVFLLMVIQVGWFSEDSLFVSKEMHEQIWPEEDMEDLDMHFNPDSQEDVVWVEEVTFEEFKIIRDRASFTSLGRWETGIVENMWTYRLGSPLAMIWLYGLAFGHGFTARLTSTKIVQFLGQLSYTIYFLHTPVSMYYWLLTRGLERQSWWKMVGDYPLPVNFLEFWYITALTGFAGYLMDRYAVPCIVPYTVGAWVSVMKAIERLFNVSLSKKESNGSSVFDMVKSITQELSGVEVSMSTRLDSMGLDSLGASAFLGLLRKRLPAAKGLSLSQLTTQLETVGELVSYLSKKPVAQERKAKIS